jgi:hypothetical protein
MYPSPQAAPRLRPRLLSESECAQGATADSCSGRQAARLRACRPASAFRAIRHSLAGSGGRFGAGADGLHGEYDGATGLTVGTLRGFDARGDQPPCKRVKSQRYPTLTLQPVVCGDMYLVAFHHRLLRNALGVVKLEGVSLCGSIETRSKRIRRCSAAPGMRGEQECRGFQAPAEIAADNRSRSLAGSSPRLAPHRDPCLATVIHKHLSHVLVLPATKPWVQTGLGDCSGGTASQRLRRTIWPDLRLLH